MCLKGFQRPVAGPHNLPMHRLICEHNAKQNLIWHDRGCWLNLKLSWQLLSQISKVTRGGRAEWLGAVAQSSEGLVTMISADGAVSCGLMISLILDCDGPGNTADLLGEDVHTLGGDAAVAVVPTALLLLVRTHEAVAAGQVVSGEGDGTSVGFGVGRTVCRHRGRFVLGQQRCLYDAVCWQCSTGYLGGLQRFDCLRALVITGSKMFCTRHSTNWKMKWIF